MAPVTTMPAAESVRQTRRAPGEVPPENRVHVPETLAQGDQTNLASQRYRLTPVVPKTLTERAARNGVCILDQGQKVVVSALLAVVDADETLLADTLEELHDGPRARFAKAVLSALREQGKVITEEAFVKDGFWNTNFRKFSGLNEAGWYAGLCGCIREHFSVDVRPESLARHMAEVLRNEFDDFARRITVVPAVPELVSGFAAQGAKLALCTTTDEAIIGPFLRGFGLLARYNYEGFAADKKVIDPTNPKALRFSGEKIQAICRDLKVDPGSSVMIGDSVADYGAAAMAGIPFVILRVPEHLLHKHRGDFGAAADAIVMQIEMARADNAHIPHFRETQTIIVGCFSQITPKIAPDTNGANPEAPANSSSVYADYTRIRAFYQAGLEGGPSAAARN